jgi:hypothetical protein
LSDFINERIVERGMSLPPAPVAAATIVALNPIEHVLSSINTNPYFIGLMMLLLNLGGRFLGMEVTKEQEKFFQQPWIRRTLIFTVLFVATRNVFVALIMTIIVLLLLSFLFNENSDLYLFTKAKNTVTATGGMTPEETEIFRKLSEKHAKIAASEMPEKQSNEPKESLEETYANNITKLRQGSM